VLKRTCAAMNQRVGSTMQIDPNLSERRERALFRVSYHPTGATNKET